MAHHYYASNGLGWSTAETMQKAIEKLWHANHTDVRKWLNNCHKDGQPGISFYVCRVPLPAEQSYRIEFYAPKVPGCTEQANLVLTYYSKKKIAWTHDKVDKIRALQAEIEQLKNEGETA